MESWAAANEEQARYRGGGEAAHWLAYEERYARVLASFAGYLLAAAAIGRVGRVAGVGCGTGSTTRAAGRAAVDGGALDLGLSSAMPRQAARRARPERLGNAGFEHGDASVHRFTPRRWRCRPQPLWCDVLRRPGGRVRRHRPRPSPRGPAGLRAPAEPRRQRMDLDRGPRQRGRLHVALPSPGDPAAPGPFSLGDRGRIAAVLHTAVLSDVAIEHRGQRCMAIHPHGTAPVWAYRRMRPFRRDA